MKLAVVATIFLSGALAWAQDSPGATPQDQGGGQPEYGGPSVPGRGQAASVLTGGDLVDLHPYLGATGLYGKDQDVSGNSYGETAMWGVTGTHKWAHSILDLDYHGYFRNYTGKNWTGGFDNSVDLVFRHQLSERIAVTLTENLARVTSSFSLPLGSLYGGGTAFNPLYNGLTANHLTTKPTLASVGGVRLIYQLSSRLSISAGGSGILSREYLTQTIGANGYIANGDIAYRLSRYQTVSFGYSFTHFGYVGQFGQTEIHGLGLSYSMRIGRYWELAASGGVSRAESLGAMAVQLDPILAQLLGFDVVFEKVHDVFYMPTATLRLTRSFRHSTWSANYNRSVMGGAGLYSASTYEQAGSTYSFWGLRRVGLDVGGSYYRYSALNESLARYRAFGASTGISVPLGKGFSSVGRFDYRVYDISKTIPTRTSYLASLGISWSPRSYPVSLW